MLALSRLVRLLLPFVWAEARTEVRGYCLHIALAVLAGLVGLMGVVMLVGSVFLRLAETMTAAAAAAVTGGGLLVIAGLIALTVGLLSRARRRRPLRKPANGGMAAIAELLAAGEAAIARDARSEAPRFAIMALLAGCVLGASPSLRKTLLDLVSR
jgi:predicted cation transporter